MEADPPSYFEHINAVDHGIGMLEADRWVTHASSCGAGVAVGRHEGTSVVFVRRVLRHLAPACVCVVCRWSLSLSFVSSVNGSVLDSLTLRRPGCVGPAMPTPNNTTHDRVPVTVFTGVVKVHTQQPHKTLTTT